MRHEQYQNLIVSPDFREYEFISIGPKGEIKKSIQFVHTSYPDTYNLSFGNLKEDGEIDDLSVDDNKDRNKILATVVRATTLFLREYPDKQIIFTGSTPQRTRLYRMVISLNLDELSIDFEIFGLLKDMESFVILPFQRGLDYFGFLVKGKK